MFNVLVLHSAILFVSQMIICAYKTYKFVTLHLCTSLGCFKNKGLYLLPWNSFVSNVYPQLEYYAGAFQDLQLIVLVVSGTKDKALHSCMLAHF